MSYVTFGSLTLANKGNYGSASTSKGAESTGTVASIFSNTSIPSPSNTGAESTGTVANSGYGCCGPSSTSSCSTIAVA